MNLYCKGVSILPRPAAAASAASAAAAAYFYLKKDNKQQTPLGWRGVDLNYQIKGAAKLMVVSIKLKI